jgi:hypothetical protein
VQTGDWLFRPAVFPLFNKKKDFDSHLFWNLQDDGQMIEGSLVWERLAPLPGYVHAYGCRLARRFNDAEKRKGNLKNAHRMYCGCYQLNVDAVRALPGTPNLLEIATADVVHKIEDSGELAHAAVVIRLKAAQGNLEGVKTAIMDRLWRAARGPLAHVCQEDEAAREHLAQLLPAGPNGPFVDARSGLRRGVCYMRFQLDRLVWCGIRAMEGT